MDENIENRIASSGDKFKSFRSSFLFFVYILYVAS